MIVSIFCSSLGFIRLSQLSTARTFIVTLSIVAAQMLNVTR